VLAKYRRLVGKAGRGVMAIPCSPLASCSLGCNQLIREGTVLMQRPEEVIELLQSFAGAPRSRFRMSVDAGSFDYAELAEADMADGAAVVVGLLSLTPKASTS
jgi:DNA processing protein